MLINFFINQIAITIFRVGENKKFIGVKLSMGVGLLKIFLVEIIESVIVALLANILLFISIGYINDMIDSFYNSVVDLGLTLSLSLISILVCVVISLIFLLFVSRLNLREIIVSEEVA